MKGSLCIDLFESLEKRQLTQYIVNPGADLIRVLKNGKKGALGCNLYVSTNELEYTMKSECY